ncbi:TPA: hypothetical protein ACM4E9_004237 [Escherichia coli]
MNNIILYSPCSYTELAIRDISATPSLFQYNIINVSRFVDLLIYLNSMDVDDRNIIIIDINEKSANWRVNYLSMLWNFRRIASHSYQLKKTSFLLLANEKQSLPSFLNHLPLLISARQVEHALLHVINNMDNYILKPITTINRKKRFMIYAITKGLSTAQIAGLLNITLKSARNRQELLMRQIGIKNRYELALLSGIVLF